MKTEYEVKILEIDPVKIRQKLQALGAKKVALRQMRRFIYNHVKPYTGKWLRLRDTGTKVELTIKEIEHEGIDGTKELEVQVSDFETMNTMLKKMGLHPSAYQENRRESYKLGAAQIEIDHWPKIPPYVEIEADCVEEVEKAVVHLGFTMQDTTSKSVMQIYEKYGLDINSFKELRHEK